MKSEKELALEYGDLVRAVYQRWVKLPYREAARDSGIGHLDYVGQAVAAHVHSALAAARKEAFDHATGLICVWMQDHEQPDWMSNDLMDYVGRAAALTVPDVSDELPNTLCQKCLGTGYMTNGMFCTECDCRSMGFGAASASQTVEHEPSSQRSTLCQHKESYQCILMAEHRGDHEMRKECK
jgi:hypothetical protein